MKLRALGRVNVCAASSSIAAYASTSTTIPEHSPQISSAPISSRAHVSGSRLKKAERAIFSVLFRGWQCLFIIQFRSFRLAKGEDWGERFDRCRSQLLSTDPHPALLPPEGEAPGVHAYIRKPSRHDNRAFATRLTRRLV